MKVFLVFVFIVFIGLSAVWSRSEDNMKYLAKVARRCANSTGATEDDVQQYLDVTIPQNRRAKCLYACINKLFGVINKDIEFVPQALKEYARLTHAGQPEFQRVLGEIVDTCAQVNDTDECELAYKILNCLVPESELWSLTEEDMKYVLKITKRCANVTGATEEDVQSFMARDLGQGRSGKCLYACMHKLFGVITKNIEFNPQALKDLARWSYSGQPQLHQVASEIVDACAQVTDTDECELAYKVTNCLMQEADRKNFNFREW
ncbi:hypothetical protein DMENIID0001_043280 [Sergentomyia squamirostris]